MLGEFGAQRPLNERFLEALHHLVELARRHRPGWAGKVLEDRLRNVCRLRFARTRHSCSSCSASNTKMLTVPRKIDNSLAQFIFWGSGRRRPAVPRDEWIGRIIGETSDLCGWSGESFRAIDGVKQIHMAAKRLQEPDKKRPPLAGAAPSVASIAWCLRTAT
jgi:hypothetical protein